MKKFYTLAVLVLLILTQVNAAHSSTFFKFKTESKIGTESLLKKSGLSGSGVVLKVNSLHLLKVMSVPPPTPIVANLDSGFVNGYDGNASLVNIFVNDSFNSLPLVGSAMKVTLAPTNSHIQIDTLTGNVNVTSGIPEGTYTINYTICDTADLSNCASSVLTIYVSAPLIIANSESASVNGYDGNANLLNVYGNDSINGISVTAGAVTSSIITAASNPGVSLNVSTGVVSVAVKTPAGIYTIQYKNCDTLNPANCDTATVTITVTAPVIIANSDNCSVNGYNGQSNLINVLVNDSLHAIQASIGPVTLTVITPSGNAGITLQSSGAIDVAANTHAGNYTIVYRICDSVNVGNCDTSIVYITVLPPPIFANADYVEVNGYNGSLNVLNIYSNDNLNGGSVTPSKITMTTLVTPSEPGVILNNSTGKISVFPMTPAGIYYFIYRICDTMNVSNCDTGLVTINVLPPPIVANGDAGSANGYNGNNNLLSVFANDSLNGKGTAAGNVTLSVVTPATHPGVALNITTGIVSVATGTPASVYTVTYRICDTMNTSSCDTAIITVNVTMPVIKANSDNAPVNGYNGNANLLNVLSNDSINGAGFVAGAVNLSLLSAASNSGIVLNLVSGNVSVSGIIPAGIYTLSYKICDTLNPANCDSAIVTVNVTAPAITGTADQASVNGTNGTSSLLNVFANDSMNGHLTSLGEVLTTIVAPATLTGIHLDTATGIVSVAALTPAGTYSIVYRICDTLNTSNCDTAIVYIHVTAPPIIATNDTGYVNGYTGTANLLNVLPNDSINNHLLGPGSVYLSVLTPAGNAGINLNTATGVVSVGPRIPAGTYTIQYQICDTLNPGSCDTGNVIIHVQSPILDAINDTGYVNGYNGSLSLLDVLHNDSINSDTIHPGAVLIRVIAGSGNAGVNLDTLTGMVMVAPLTPAGSYNIHYRISDTLNLSNTDSAYIHVVVSAPAILAMDDKASINGYSGSNNLLNVLSNDSINHVTTIPGAVKLTLIADFSHAGITLDTLTGIIKVLPRVPSGLYTMSYRICDTINTSNCDTATDSITVTAPPIMAINDSASVNGYVGSTNLLTVLDNDSINGVAIIAGDVKLNLVTPASHPGIVMNDTTGIVSATARIPVGTYYITYSITDTLNPLNSDTGLVVINITAPLIVAINDTAIVNGVTGASLITNVLYNDTIDGVQATVTNIKLIEWIPSGNSRITLDTLTGFLTVLPNTSGGIYHIKYIVQDTLSAGNRDTAILYIEVIPPAIYANPDFVSVNGYSTNLNVLNVLLNDSLNGSILTIGKVNMAMIIGASDPGIILNTANGKLSVFPGTPAGDYQLIYRICDTLNPTNCDTALINVHVSAPLIFAQNDNGQVNGYMGSNNLLNVLQNDSINHILANASSVFIKIVTPFSNSLINLDTLTGVVSVGHPVPAGTYTCIYQIIDTLNSGNRDTAIAFVNILPSNLIAINDTGSVSGYTGSANLLNVLSNDSLNGVVADTSFIDIYVLTPSGNAGVILDTITGRISVAPSTYAGTYAIEYRITDTLGTGNSDTAFAIIHVGSGNVYAMGDTGMVNGYKGQMSLLNVLVNDSLNGMVTTAGIVKLQIITPSGNAGVTLDTLTGIVDVAPRTPAGTYSICYRISDTLNLNNYDSDFAVIHVHAVAPVAQPDSATTANSTPIVIKAVLNDYDADTNLNIASINVYIPPVHGIAVKDTVNGFIKYSPFIGYVGYDTLYYSICDSGMVPVLCDTSFIIIRTMDSLSVKTLVVVHEKCFGDTSGSILLTLKGGVPPYVINWNSIPMQFGNMAVNLRAGTYQASVLDSMFQSITVNVTITEPSSPVFVTTSSTEPKCNGDFNGIISATAGGGTAPYKYLWSTGSILQNLTNAAAGTYLVTVTDTNGCKASKNTTLGQPLPISFIDSLTVIEDVICKSSPEGSIAITVTGGVSPYKYLWSTGDTTSKLEKVSDGIYKITVKDVNLCSTVGYYQINYSKENCENDVFITQGFSPDGDGVNDAFTIDGIEKYPDNYLRIYNRWGGLVFEAHGYKNTWKGTVEAGVVVGSGDEQLPTGTYFYVLDLGAGIKTSSGYFYISK